MPGADTLERFIAVVERNAHVEAIERLDELAYQRLEGEQVVEEKFYYDPAQLQR